MKVWVHARVHWPEEAAGGWHLPSDISEGYCRQIANETRVRKPAGGYTWVARGARDYLDAEAMAYAAAKMVGVERIKDTSRQRPQRATSAATAPSEPHDDTTPPPPPPPASSGGFFGERTEGWWDR